MTENMVERVAMAIYASTWDPSHGPADMVKIEVSRKQARAAIEAMREPTEEMQRRGSAMYIDTLQAPGHPERTDDNGFTLPALVAWRAMINAALDTKDKDE